VDTGATPVDLTDEYTSPTIKRPRNELSINWSDIFIVGEILVRIILNETSIHIVSPIQQNNNQLSWPTNRPLINLDLLKRGLSLNSISIWITQKLHFKKDKKIYQRFTRQIAELATTRLAETTALYTSAIESNLKKQ
jgi:hypothetical protein